MKKQFYLIEHAFLYIHKNNGFEQHQNGSLGIPEKEYRTIEAFILKNIEKGIQYLCPGYHKFYGQILKANQYVGVIETRSGVVVEILPKVHSDDLGITRKTLLTMLSCNRSIPIKSFDFTSLQKARLPLLDIFIQMFCDELSLLIKKGLQSEYIPREENQRFLKGRLLVSQQLKMNYIHKERLYSSFEEYELNRIENRIIRTTIDFLIKKQIEGRLKKRLREFQYVFSDIEPIKNNKDVFKSLILDRKMIIYEKILTWCSIFLGLESFSSSVGDNIALSLFFDMNRLFETFVFHNLKKANPSIAITAQDNTKYLLENPKGFRLRPDILIEKTLIADTKWKILDYGAPFSKIAQSDLYQMYAYGKKYVDVNTLCLIYPQGSLPEDSFGNEYLYETGLKIKIIGFNCIEKKIIGIEKLENLLA